MLFPGQLANDSLDLAARLLMIRLQGMKLDVIDETVLSNVTDYVHVVEFQKCSLLHLPCNFSIASSSSQRLKGPEDVDKLVCTEFPFVQCQKT